MPKSVEGVMHEFKHGELHSGSKSGPVVKSRKQAVAIAMSEQRQKKGKKKKKRTAQHTVNSGLKVSY